MSVIIPVYNASKHLGKCLDSVRGQSHRNIEIILIDDGSTDGSGELCDRYAAEDDRIKVLHQNNTGVAGARNAGLDAASGAYIGWVDADDWIEPQMFESMLNGARSYGADVVICGRVEHYPDHSAPMGWQQPECLDRRQALALLILDDQVRSYLCDKLWRRELFDGIRFPDLKAFEDMAVLHKVFEKTERMLCLPGYFYHYEHYGASLTSKSSLRDQIAFYEISKGRYELYRGEYPQLVQQLETGLVTGAAHVWAAYYNSTKEERRIYKSQIQTIAAFCKDHYSVALKETQMGLAGRMVLRLVPYAKPWAFRLVWLVNWLYKRKHGVGL